MLPTPARLHLLSNPAVDVDAFVHDSMPLRTPSAGSAEGGFVVEGLPPMIKILFLAANPRDTDRLRLDEEVRAIDEALRKADFRDYFELHSHGAVRIEDLQELLLRYQPQIVHFSGHGKGTPSVRPSAAARADATNADRHLLPVPEEAEEARRSSGQIVLQDARGREALTAELVAYLRTHRFLAVVGASGSGKSSLVRAGLVPALQRGTPVLDDVLPPEGSALWPIHIITPKAHPSKELAATLTSGDASHLAQAKLMDELAQDARVLDLCVSRLLSGGAAKRLLLVVDQFEELFTLCRDQTERKAFIDNLLTAAVDDGVTTVVITLRADFYAHCFAFDNLRTALESYQKNIGPMSRDELRRAIEEPARLEGWAFEPGLVDLLLHDVGDEPGALPLLSHALLETWKRRRGRTLTLAGYVESGRVQGAIAQTAERVFTQHFTAEQQTIAKNIFLRLTELGEGAEDTRRRVQLVELMSKPAEQATIEAVLKTLADARLVTTDKAEVEVAHEALIRSWPTLRQWLDENREGLRIHRRLTEAAQEWEALKRDQGALYRGLRLQQALEWESKNAVEFSLPEKTFLNASKAVAIRQQRQRRWTIGASIAAVFVLIVVLGGWLIIQQRNQAIYKQLRSEATVAREALNPDAAIQKLTAASTVFPDLFDLGVEVQSVRQHVANAWLAEAGQLKADLQPEQAIAKLRAAHDLYPELLDLETEVDDVRRHVATVWVQEGEQLAKTSDYEGASAKFEAAIALEPPSDIPVYVWIEASEFTMGENIGEHRLFVNEFWIGRTEVTNAQYIRCIEAAVCEPPFNSRYENPDLIGYPVTNVTWFQAKTYAGWVGGRLPTEAEWEKACRGMDSRIYPWGDEIPTRERANFDYTIGSTVKVGSYLPGANGLYDMAGNVLEWTNSQYKNYPYDAHDGREEDEDDAARVLRGGSWYANADNVRCTVRRKLIPNNPNGSFGFRVVVSSPGF